MNFNREVLTGRDRSNSVNHVEATNEQVADYLAECPNATYVGIKIAQAVGETIYYGERDDRGYCYLLQSQQQNIMQMLSKATQPEPAT